jgi:hypothetical protein
VREGAEDNSVGFWRVTQGGIAFNAEETESPFDVGSMNLELGKQKA